MVLESILTSVIWNDRTLKCLWSWVDTQTEVRLWLPTIVLQLLSIMSVPKRKFHLREPAVMMSIICGMQGPMAIRVVEFSNGVYKIKTFFASESTYPKEIYKNFLRVYWFWGKNLSNLLYPSWKLHNPYCHMGCGVFKRGI